MNITLSKKFIKEVKEKFECDYGWEWEDDKDFLNQFHEWIIMSALDLGLDDADIIKKYKK